MHTATLTFETMGRRADRTLGILLFAKHVKHQAEGVVLFAALDFTLRSLLTAVSKTERLNALSSEQAEELIHNLRQIHSGMNDILNHPVMSALMRKSIFGKLIAGIEERTEDLYDIIETLALSENVEFRNLIADCVGKLSIGRTPEPVGRM